MIDSLTDRRIRRNREFFNVSPQVALEIFNDIAETINDAVVEVYDPKVSPDHPGPPVIKPPKRPRFKFSMVGIKLGEFVTFDPTGVEVKVLNDDKIEYKGKPYKLSSFTRDFMPKDMRNSSGAYQDPKYFSYKGKTLDELRTEAEM